MRITNHRDDPLRFFNDVGSIITFANNPHLKDLVVVDPEWLFRFFASFFETVRSRGERGLISMTKLEKLWVEQGYQRSVHGALINILTKFELAFEFGGDFGSIKSAARSDRSNSQLDMLLRTSSSGFAVVDDGVEITEGSNGRLRLINSISSSSTPLGSAQRSQGSHGVLTPSLLNKVPFPFILIIVFLLNFRD